MYLLALVLDFSYWATAQLMAAEGRKIMNLKLMAVNVRALGDVRAGKGERIKF